MAELTEQIRLYEPHRRQPRIAAIGGGHGLSAMLRGLKTYTKNITAIVTVADDGGGSGMLREDLGMLPPGDIRNCIMALANTEPTMQQLLNYQMCIRDRYRILPSAAPPCRLEISLKRYKAPTNILADTVGNCKHFFRKNSKNSKNPTGEFPCCEMRAKRV